MICANSSWNLVNYRSGLIRALIAGGNAVVALAPRDASTGDVEALGCRFIELPMNPSATDIFSNFRLLQRFIGILRRERPDYFLCKDFPECWGSEFLRRDNFPGS